jgi:hypothetical protein
VFLYQSQGRVLRQSEEHEKGWTEGLGKGRSISGAGCKETNGTSAFGRLLESS